MPSPPVQQAQFGFTKGLNQSIDERQIDPDALTVANNVTYQGGSFGKRHGFDMTATGLSAATQLISYKNELLATDGKTLRSKYSGGWTSVDKVSPCTVYADPVALSYSSPVINADLGYVSAAGNSYHVLVCSQNANRGSGTFAQLVCEVYDANTGAQVVSNLFLSQNVANNYTNPRIAAIGSSVYVFSYRDDGALVYNRILFSTGSPVVANLENVAINPTNLSTKFTVCSGNAGGTNYLYLIGLPTSIPRTINVVAINEATGVATAYTPTAAVGTVLAMGACFVNGNVNIAYASINGANTDIHFLQVSGSTPSTITTADAVVYQVLLTNSVDKLGMCNVSTGRSVIFAQDNPASSPNYSYLWLGVVNEGTGALVGTKSNFFNHRMISEPFTYGGTLYIQLEEANYRFNAASQYIASVDWTQPAVGNVVQYRPIANMGERQCNTQILANGGTAIHVSATPISTQLKTIVEVGATPNSINEMWLATLDFAHPANGSGAVLGDHAYICGGLPSVYDGKRVSEVGFTTFPDPPDPTLTASGTGSLDAGTYQYRICWEMVDARGYIVRSAPSPIITISSLPANSNVSLKIPNPQLTNRVRYENGSAPLVYAVIYRTKHDQSDVFYRLTKQSTPSTVNGSLICAPQTQYLTYTDNTPDSTMVANAYGYLYTVGGELADEAPPSFVHLVAFKDRLWGVGWDRRTIWYSKQLVVGYGSAFNETLTFSLDDDGRPIVALASLDDYLVIFKERSIYVVSGDGPADSGQGSDLSVPRPVNTDVGCVDPRSIVRTPHGLMFLSRKGICLLNRGLEVSFPGYNVEKEVSSYPNCGGAAPVEQDNQVVWWMNNGSTSEAIVYDHLFDVWTTWTLANAGEKIVASVSHNGTHAALSLAGNAYTQNRTSFTDNGAGYKSTLETGWIKPAGLLGFCRINSYFLLAIQNASSDLQSYFYYDYAPSVTEAARTWTVAQLGSMYSVPGPIQVSVAPNKPEGTAIKLGFTDYINAVPAGDSFNFIGFGVEFSPEQGLSRVNPAAHR